MLVIGSGPIVIGQACEFDYSGTQACKALARRRSRGRARQQQPGDDHDRSGDRRPHLRRAADAEVLAAIIERERPDAILPTVGGQTALNLAVRAGRAGMLAKYNVELIGASIEAIKVAEDRLLFRDAMREIGIAVPKSGVAQVAGRSDRAGRAARVPDRSSARRSRWAASAAASPTTSRSSASSRERGIEPQPRPRDSASRSR